MALITCPECHQQISDQATACPNCGFPLSKDTNTTPPIEPQTNNTAVAKPRNKKKIVITVCVVLCVLLSALAALLVKQNSEKKARAEYIADLNDFLLSSLSGAAEAENLCNLTYNVWYDTIYENYRAETAPYTKINGTFRDDFNDSLITLYADDSTIETISEINSNRTIVDEIYKRLSNPTDEFQSCYAVVDEMYSAYHQLTELAINPSGTLQSYRENFGQYDNAYMEQYNKLGLLIPEE